MKALFYKLFKQAVYTRAVLLKAKQSARIERVMEAKKELREWSDIPLSMQLSSLCKILKIKPNKAAYNFLIELHIGHIDIEQAAKKLPL